MTPKQICDDLRDAALSVIGNAFWPITIDVAAREDFIVSKMIGMHNVVDVDKWLSFKADRAGAIGSMGGSNVVDLVAQDGSNAVAIVADVDDADAMIAAMAAAPPELQAAMHEHGVVPPLVFYVEK